MLLTIETLKDNYNKNIVVVNSYYTDYTTIVAVNANILSETWTYLHNGWKMQSYFRQVAS